MKFTFHIPTTKLLTIIAAAVALTAAMLVCPGTATAAGPVEEGLYSFQRNNDFWAPGPNGGLVADQGGNLYGVTCCDGLYNWGTIFELSPPAAQGYPWTETILLTFNLNNGADPYGPLVLDQAGNLYGTTSLPGLVYELSPPKQEGDPWTQKVLYEFVSNLYSPEAGTVFDQAGNIYGTAAQGGRGCGWNGGCGGVYQLLNRGGGSWEQRVIYQYGGCPKCQTGGFGTLAVDAAGALYGTTTAQRTPGTVYKLTPPLRKNGKWAHSVLYTFKRSDDGSGSETGVIFDTSGNLYGTTPDGGGTNCGTIFELTPSPAGSWTENVIYSFQGSTDGCGSANLMFDGFGNLYGTMSNGGNGSCGCGYVFELSPPADGGSWTKTVLYSFESGSDVAYPNGGVIFGLGGALYGEAIGGTGNCTVGSGCGGVYSVTP
ncbi:MAG: choice-of-anchor tandem repeat GloVer-containing protein [Terriglobales bacterium]